jgi:hypothetical protein
MGDFEARILEELCVLDPLPPGAEGNWQDVLGRTEMPGRRRNWLLASGTILAIVAVVIAVVALLPAGGGGPSNAAAALNRLADLVATQSLTPQPGQYLYIQSKSDYGAHFGNCVTRAVEHEEIWIGTDGSGLDRDTREPGYFTSAADRATCLQEAQKFGTQKQLQEELAPDTSSDWNAPNCLELGPTNDWSSLSTDPQTLLQQIAPNLGRPPTSYDQLSTIESYLHDTDAPPEVRATLYRAAALIPGVQLLGTVRDHDGRPGLGVALTFALRPGSTEPSTYELIFDPKTGELSGEIQTGALAGWTVYLRNKVVDSLPSKPPAPLGPPCQTGHDAIVHRIPRGSITNGAPLE